jgi:hypothetical protein
MSTSVQNKWLIALGLYVIISSIWPYASHQSGQIEPIKLLEAKSSIFDGKEDLQSRWEYEQQMLQDPSTGEIPYNFKLRDKEFAQRMIRAKFNSSQSVQSSNAQNQAEELNWLSVGPNNFGGRTRSLAFDILDQNVLLAGGVSGGMWKSTNFGQSWVKTTGPGQIHSTSAIAQDIRNGKESTWYMGTGELVGNSTRAPGAPFRGDGIFKSIDNGDSWSQLASTVAPQATVFSSPLQYVWDITTDPSSSDDVVIAAVWSGIVRSEDGGNSWTTVLGRDLLNLPSGTDLNDVESIFYTDVHRTTDNTFYATLSSRTNEEPLATEAGIYRSLDGINWTRILPLNGTSNRRTEIGSSPSDPDQVYFLTDGNSGHELRFYDAAANQFTNLSASLPDGSNDIETLDSQNSYDLLVRVHPTDPNLVFIGGTNLYRSSNGFEDQSTTSWIGGYNPSEEGGSLYPNHHPDQHDVLFVPSNPNQMISVNDGGLYLTQNVKAETVEYSSLNNGYQTTQFYTGVFSQYPEDDFVIGGTQDNGSLLTQNSNTNTASNGTRVIGGDGAFAATTRFGVYYYMSFQNSRIYRLTLNEDAEITSFTRIDPVGGGARPDQSYLFINPYTLDPNNGNRMYLAGGDQIWRNRNLSQIPSGSNSPTSTNWSSLTRTRLSEGVISAVAVSTKPANVVYYGSSRGQLRRIDNANGESYEVSNITSQSFPEGGYIRSIAVDPTNSDRLLVSFSNYNVKSLFYSEDSGQNFTSVSGNLEENPDGTGAGPSVRWVSIVPKSDGTSEYFVGTSIGLYRTNELNNEATTWSQESDDQIGNVVVNMIDYRRYDGKVVVATHGNGMYTSQISDVLPFDGNGDDSTFEFESVFPNPFDDFTTLSFNVPETDFTRLRVYDSSGRLVYINSGALAFTGNNEFFWSGTNTLDQPVPDGVYLLRLTYRQNSLTKKVLLSR